MRTVFACLVMLLVTPVFAIAVIGASVARRPESAERDLRSRPATLVAHRALGGGRATRAPRRRRPAPGQAARVRGEPRELVRHLHAPRDPSALSLRRQGGAVQDSAVRSSGATRRHDSDPAREPEGSVPGVRRGGARISAVVRRWWCVPRAREARATRFARSRRDPSSSRSLQRRRWFP